MKLKSKINKTFRKENNNRNKTRYQKGKGYELEVFYKDIKVNSQELSKELTKTIPLINFPTTDKLYTLIMWDPDVSNNFKSSWVHWISINLKIPNDIHTNTILKYNGPTPPSGIHRYYFGLFEQAYKINPNEINSKIQTRKNFDVNKFSKDKKLSKINEIFMYVSSV
jgi:phosphatidylethanolamine-binding protein (PEBP) family uncharacterized protein